jgi:hypothetical protein
LRRWSQTHELLFGTIRVYKANKEWVQGITRMKYLIFGSAGVVVVGAGVLIGVLAGVGAATGVVAVDVVGVLALLESTGVPKSEAMH